MTEHLHNVTTQDIQRIVSFGFLWCAMLLFESYFLNFFDVLSQDRIVTIMCLNGELSSTMS
jgi:hypothetical protein